MTTLTPAQVVAQSMKDWGSTPSDIAQALAGPSTSCSADVIASTLLSSDVYPNLTSADLLAALQSASPPLTAEAIHQAVTDAFGMPTIISLSPQAADLGSGDLVLTINGRGFKPEASVGWNGTSLTPTGIADAQIVVTVPAAQLLQAGSNQVTVTNPGPVVSNSATFVLNTPQPYIASVSPNTIDVGTADVTLTITGAHFTSDSLVLWNDSTITPISVASNGTQIIVQVTNKVLRSSSTGVVAVQTAAGRLTSQTVALTLNIPHPAISTVDPASVLVGSPTQTLAVVGSGFASSAVLTWNDDQLSTTVTSATQLSAGVTADRLQVAALAMLRVVNVDYPDAQSDAHSFTVANPQPQLSRLDPASGYAGDPDLPLTVYGGVFAQDVQVLWGGTGGTPLAIVHFSADQLGVTVPASLLQTVQTVNVMVVNPGPGGGTSNEVAFDVAQRVPQVSSILPVWGAAGQDLPITVDGSNFMSGASLSWTSGDQTTSITPTQVMPTSLTATVPGGQVSRNAALKVVNPPPGGSSAEVSVTVFPGLPVRLMKANTTNQYLGFCSFEEAEGRYIMFNALQVSGAGDELSTLGPDQDLHNVGWQPFTWQLVKDNGTGPLMSGDEVVLQDAHGSCVFSTNYAYMNGQRTEAPDGDAYHWDLGGDPSSTAARFIIYLAKDLQTDQYEQVPFTEQFGSGPIVAGSTVAIVAKGRTTWYRDMGDEAAVELTAWQVELPPGDQLPPLDR